MKEARHTDPHSIGFHLGEMSRTGQVWRGRCGERASSMVVSKAGGDGRVGGLMAKVSRGFSARVEMF